MTPSETGPGIGKMPTGIEGLDEITGGGLPRGCTTLILGGPGAGKTVLALQTLVNGARVWGEPGIFCAFEENARRIVANAATFGWNLPALEEAGLFYLDTRMSMDAIRSGAFDLSGMLSSLEAKANEMGAQRIVFDSIGVLLSLLDDPLAERRELDRVHEWLSATGLTGILTARGGERGWPDGYDFLPYMADAIVLLRQQLTDRVSQRQLRVCKYRGSAFAEGIFPLLIGPAGMEVASFGLETELNYAVSTERVSTGVPHLDAMLQQGYYRGTSVLITGAPGTAKSTLCGAFIQAACQRGERALYVTFDEGACEVVRNLASVNIQLEPAIHSGLLRMYAARTQSRSAEAHLVHLRSLIRTHQPHCLVIDPLSAMMNAGGQTSALAVAQQLLHITKDLGITVVFTSILDSTDPDEESTPLAISTIADTWIHLSYITQRGERQRTLTIVKSRGTHHSRRVRELVLGDMGVTLADLAAPAGQTAPGAPGWPKALAGERPAAPPTDECERRRHISAPTEAKLRLRIESLQRELDTTKAQLAALQSQGSPMSAHESRRELRAIGEACEPCAPPSQPAPTIAQNQAPPTDQPTATPRNGLVLRLYVTADAPNSIRARANLAALCREYPLKCHLEVIDISQEPLRALKDNILATPTLVKLSPGPTRKVIGDLADASFVLSALGMDEKKTC
ncbi:MAG: circadian clock protein KaiC [Chloroflexi bacterium]|nr:circadian clock protein KaiC [Chloroflexota bacterium]